MLVNYRVIQFAGTHLYTWVERATTRAKFLAQEHIAPLDRFLHGLWSYTILAINIFIADF